MCGDFSGMPLCFAWLCTGRVNRLATTAVGLGTIDIVLMDRRPVLSGPERAPKMEGLSVADPLKDAFRKDYEVIDAGFQGSGKKERHPHPAIPLSKLVQTGKDVGKSNGESFRNLFGQGVCVGSKL